jgi:hypothetical protein
VKEIPLATTMWGNIEIGLKEIRCEAVEYINLVQNSEEFWDLVKKAMSFGFTKCAKFLN